MEITQQCVVALTWTSKTPLVKRLDVLDEPVEFLLGGNDLLPASKKPCKATAQAPSCRCTWNLKGRLWRLQRPAALPGTATVPAEVKKNGF